MLEKRIAFEWILKVEFSDLMKGFCPSSTVYSFRGICQITFHIDFKKIVIILRQPLQWAGSVLAAGVGRWRGISKAFLIVLAFYSFFFSCTTQHVGSSSTGDQAHAAALQSSFLTTGWPGKSLSFITSCAGHESNKETLISTVLHGPQLRWADQSGQPAPRFLWLGEGHYPTPQ